MKNIVALSFCLLFVIPSSGSADVLCYRRASKGKGNHNVVQIFAGEKCPKRYIKVHDSALGQVLTVKGEAGIAGPQGEQGKAGIQGEQGPAGATGATGDVGEKGEIGAPGDAGAQGLKGEAGDPGATGVDGDLGDQGLRGDTGETGAAGISPVGLFDFYGSSAGDTLSGGIIYEMQINEVVAPIVHTGNFNVASRSVPIGSSCSKIQYYIQLNGEMAARFFHTPDHGVAGEGLDLCLENTCEGQLDINITSDRFLSLYLIPVAGVNPATRAIWNIKCIQR